MSYTCIYSIISIILYSNIYILHSAWTGWVGALYHHDCSFLAPELTTAPSLWMEEILQHQKDG